MSEITPLTKDQLFEKKIAENTGSDYNVGDISDVVPVTKDQSFLKEIALNSAGLSGDITELEEKVSATQDMLSDAYDPTQTYNVGDYCIHEDVLYKCNTASTTGTWDSSKWDATTVGSEMTIIKEAIADTGWISLNSTYKLYYRRINKIVTILFQNAPTVPPNTVLGTLPEGCRPISPHILFCSPTGTGFVGINYQGEISVSETIVDLASEFMFVTDN